jgi:Protein of unknown function (DUF2384)
VRSKAAIMTDDVVKMLETLRVKGAIKYVDVAMLLGKRPETVSRWNNGRTYPRVYTEKTLYDLELIVTQLADLFEPKQTRQWIFAPQKRLGGISPADLIRAGQIDEVAHLVAQLRLSQAPQSSQGGRS